MGEAKRRRDRGTITRWETERLTRERMTKWVRETVPDVEFLDAKVMERIIASGDVSYEQLEAAHERGAMFYSPSTRTFMDLREEPPQ